MFNFIFGVNEIGYLLRIFIIIDFKVVVKVVVVNIVFWFIFILLGRFFILFSDSIDGLINKM